MKKGWLVTLLVAATLICILTGHSGGAFFFGILLVLTLA